MKKSTLLARRDVLAGASTLALPRFAIAQTRQKAHIGVLQTAGAGAMYIARDKGHFAAAGLDPEIHVFDNAQTLAVGIATDALDFGATSLAIGFFNLAARGVVRIIGAQGRDAPGFPNNGFVVSMAAWEKGFRKYEDMRGKIAGLPTPGSGPHYAFALVAKKYGVPMSSLDIQWLKSSPNLVVALSTNRVDCGVTPAINVLTLEKNKQAKLIGWVGDEVPWQLGGAYTSAKHADTNGPFVEKFLRGYQAGIRDFHDAFTTPDGKRLDGPTAPEMLAIMSKALDQPAELLREGITYMDREGRIDGRDIAAQIAWHKAEGLLEGDVDPNVLMDKRYVKFLP
jgi:NitT/TauT family transport system substrate-binding protein